MPIAYELTCAIKLFFNLHLYNYFGTIRDTVPRKKTFKYIYELTNYVYAEKSILSEFTIINATLILSPTLKFSLISTFIF